MAQMVKNPSAGGLGSIPWVRKIPWRRKWQPNPVFLPGKSHGQRGLAGGEFGFPARDGLGHGGEVVKALDPSH